MKRAALLLFLAIFCGLFAWLFFGSRSDVREAPPDGFQVVALVEEGGGLAPRLLPLFELRELQKRGDRVIYLIPEGQEGKVREALWKAWADKGGEALELTVERVGPGRQSITLETRREGMGGPLWDTSWYEATVDGVRPLREWRFFLSAVTLILLGIGAGLLTGGIVVGWWTFVWVLAQVRRRRTARG